MFFGEFVCILVFKYMVFSAIRNNKPNPDESKPFSPLIFLLPACCDMAGTSLMYLGLTLTDASVFQMLRGSVVIFTGILSVVFLKRKLEAFQWASMFLVLIGTAIVGYASISGGHATEAAKNPILGDALIIIAQVVTAIQMVVEEKFVGGYNVSALQAVGYEGCWGTIILSTALIGMYFIPSDVGVLGSFESTPDAITQVGSSGSLLLAIILNMISIGFFNYFGIAVTKAMSASHRMVLDTLRTIVIWVFSISYGWEKQFKPLQLGGFVVLIAGTMMYNEIFKLRFLFAYKSDVDMTMTPPDDAPVGRGGSGGGATTTRRMLRPTICSRPISRGGTTTGTSRILPSLLPCQ